MLKQFLRKTVLDQLPPNWQLLFFRNYFYWLKGDYVKPEVDTFRKLCDPARAALDIGANEGLYSMYLCRFATGLNCFEPLPWMVGQLEKKFRDVKNVTVNNCALGSRTETATIRIPVTPGRQYDTRSSLVGHFDGQLINGEKVTAVKDLSVAVKRLDDFHLDNIGFIKIDVEGFELEVLKGGVETIQRNLPNLFIEIEQKHHQGETPITGVFDFILKLGYAGFFEHQGRLQPLANFDARVHQSPAHDNVKDAYCGNFIFLPAAVDARRLGFNL
jgi:FkbM family methyltransferase